MESKNIKKVTICIPTYSREKELQRLLISLAAQRNVPADYQVTILVLDNNQVSYLSRVLKGLPALPFKLRSVKVEERGLVNVRNAAVAWVLMHSQDALLFVDDDEVVPPAWLANMFTAWDKYGADIINGPVYQILPFDTCEFVKRFELLGTHFNPPSGTRLEYANSNNTLVARRVLKKMGPSFNPQLNFSGGEDTVFFHLCSRAGFSIVWDKSVAIWEPTAPARATLKYLCARWFHMGMSTVLREQILSPQQSLTMSLKKMHQGANNIARGVAAFLLKGNRPRFGQALFRFFWVLGISYGLLGFASRNQHYK